MKSGRNEIQSQGPQLFEKIKIKSKAVMKISIRFRGLIPRAFWQAMAEAQIRKLQSLAAIASAEVILERQREGTPAFRARAQLEVPGPDFHAEAKDHTLEAALRKVVKNLERQIRLRKARQGERWKNHLRPGLLPHRPSPSFGGASG